MTNDKCVALVLEGGGVKCAYQVGAIMALEELGYSFKAISGASFGAVNGAIYIEGGVKKLFEYYTHIETKDIFVDEDISNFVNNYNGEKENFSSAFINFMKDSTHNVKEERNRISNYYHHYVSGLINEEAIKSSPINFYFSVLEVNNSPIVLPLVIGAYFAGSMAPLKMLEDNGTIHSHIIDKNVCSRGSLPLYVASSANYPFFNPLLVEDRYYLDGGITNNVPYEHLLEKGYEKIMIIRTKTSELQGKIPQNENISVILPSENLGSSLAFTHDNIMYLIKLGYQDTMRQINR